MLQTSFQSSLRSSKLHNHIHKPFVNNAFDWLLLVQGSIRGFVYDLFIYFLFIYIISGHLKNLHKKT
jgi:hypothetical protein